MDSRLKILLTGSNGYLGQNFLNYFSNSNFDITFILRSEIDDLIRNYENKDLFLKTNIKFKNKYDVIIHTAALSYSECKKDPQKGKTINTLLTEILTDYSIKHNCYFIFFSSVQVYGSILNGIYNEGTKISPDTEYSISKANAEKYIMNKISRNLLKGSILRIGNVVGLPKSKLSSGWKLFANNAIREAVSKKEIKIKNNRNLRRNFLPIDLLMILLRKILNEINHSNEKIPYVINVTTGESLTLFEYCQLLAEKYNEIFYERPKIFYDNSLSMDIPFSVIDNKILNDFLSDDNYCSLDKSILEAIKLIKNQNLNL